MKNLFNLFKGFWLGLLEFFAWLFDWIIRFKPYWKQIVKFVSNWNELLTIPLGFALFYFFPLLLRMIDPVAGGYDIGILHAAIAAISIMLIIHGFAWLILRLTFPGVYKYLDDVFETFITRTDSLDIKPTERDHFLLLTTFQKCAISLSLFSLYLLGTILLVRMF